MKNFFFWYLLTGFMLVSFIFFMSLLFMENEPNESGESPYECGFEPVSFSRTPFSMQFFSTTIIFLIFDLEIVVILPLLKSMDSSYVFKFFMSVIVFILLMGLVIEWFDGSLNWST